MPLFATVVVGVSWSSVWPKFSHAGFAEARTEANKTNKEIKLKKLKVELVPRYNVNIRIVPIAPVVSKLIKAIRAIIMKRSKKS